MYLPSCCDQMNYTVTRYLFEINFIVNIIDLDKCTCIKIDTQKWVITPPEATIFLMDCEMVICLKSTFYLIFRNI